MRARMWTTSSVFLTTWTLGSYEALEKRCHSERIRTGSTKNLMRKEITGCAFVEILRPQTTRAQDDSFRVPVARLDRLRSEIQVSLLVAQSFDGIEFGGLHGRHPAADHADNNENEGGHKQGRDGEL